MICIVYLITSTRPIPQLPCFLLQGRDRHKWYLCLMSSDALVEQGELKLKEENYAEAVKLFTEAMTAGASPLHVLPRRAWAYLKAGDNQKAAEEFTSSIELD